MRHRGVGIWAWILPVAIVLIAGLVAAEAQAPAKKPNILIIWGDDIGQSNLSIFTKGLMGYHTPNIDRIANEGTSSSTGSGQASTTRQLRKARMSGSCSSWPAWSRT